MTSPSRETALAPQRAPPRGAGAGRAAPCRELQGHPWGHSLGDVLKPRRRTHSPTARLAPTALLVFGPLTACGDTAPHTDSGAGAAWDVDPVPWLEIGAVAGDSAYNLDGVSSVHRLSDGRIVVGSPTTGTLSYFDANGRHLRTAGGAGKGPGEIGSLAAAWVHSGDTIGVFDSGNQRVTFFDSEGTLVREVALRPSAAAPDAFVAALPDGGFAIARIQVDPSKWSTEPFADTMVVMHYAPDGAERGELVRVGGLRRWRAARGSGVHPFSPRFVTAGSGSGFVVADGAETRFEVFDAAADARRSVSWPDTTLVPPQAAWQQLAEEVRRANDPISRLNASALPELGPGPSLPVYSALRVDPADRVWIKSYDPASDNLWTGALPQGAGGRWSVFEPDGQRVATVQMPEDLIVFEIGTDYVLGVRRDELGIEYVRLHTLRRVTGVEEEGP